MSVIARSGAYCSPRDNTGPYTAVEVGFPSDKDVLLSEYAEDRDEPFKTEFGRTCVDTVYPWVPTRTLLVVIENHGGIKSGHLPVIAPQP